MNYYPFHIGDFRSGTVNMTRQTRWIYRDLLDIYYDTEKPLPLDLEALCDMAGATTDEEQRIVERLLRFKFVKTDEGYHHPICDKVIVEYHTKAETAKTNGKLGGRPKKAKGNPEKPSGLSVGSDPVQSANPEQTGSEANQEPRTNNQEKNTKTSSEPSPDAKGDQSSESDSADRRKKPRATPDDESLASRIFGLILEGNPTAKKPNIGTWAEDIRLMREIDGRPLPEIWSMFQWVRRDPFWRTVILCPSKLREKWDQLTEKRLTSQSPQARQPVVNEKFHVNHLDRSSDAKAMEETIRRHGITVTDGEEIDL